MISQFVGFEPRVRLCADRLTEGRVIFSLSQNLKKKRECSVIAEEICVLGNRGNLGVGEVH